MSRTRGFWADVGRTGGKVEARYYRRNRVQREGYVHRLHVAGHVGRLDVFDVRTVGRAVGGQRGEEAELAAKVRQRAAVTAPVQRCLHEGDPRRGIRRLPDNEDVVVRQ